MTELKAFVARKIDDGTCDPVPCVEVYLKSEADEYIRNLEKENAELRTKNEGLLYALADAETDIAMATKWRSCSEELPPHDTWCLVCHEGEIDSDHYTDDCNSYDRFVMYGPFVTHWMPLPKAPEEEK